MSSNKSHWITVTSFVLLISGMGILFIETNYREYPSWLAIGSSFLCFILSLGFAIFNPQWFGFRFKFNDPFWFTCIVYAYAMTLFGVGFREVVKYGAWIPLTTSFIVILFYFSLWYIFKPPNKKSK